MSKCRNAEKNTSSLNALNQLCPRQARPGKSRKHKYESPYKYNKYSREAWQLAISAAGRGATTTSHAPRFISICRCRFQIYPITQVCSFFDRLPGCQSFMIYFITLQGSFPQKNGVLIKILLRTRNNGRIIEINSARKV